MQGFRPDMGHMADIGVAVFESVLYHRHVESAFVYGGQCFLGAGHRIQGHGDAVMGHLLLQQARQIVPVAQDIAAGNAERILARQQLV